MRPLEKEEREKLVADIRLILEAELPKETELRFRVYEDDVLKVRVCVPAVRKTYTYEAVGTFTVRLRDYVRRLDPPATMKIEAQLLRERIDEVLKGAPDA